MVLPCIPCAAMLAATPAAPLIAPIAGLSLAAASATRGKPGRMTGVTMVGNIARQRVQKADGDVHVGALTTWIGGGLVALFGLSVAMLARAGGRSPPTSSEVAYTAAWEDDDFVTLASIAKRLRMNPADLLLVLASESGLSPSAKFQRPEDEVPIAVGLNQLTKVSNGVTGLTEAQRIDLVHRSVREQLPILERFFNAIPWTKAGKKYTHAGLIYEANFAPNIMMSHGTSPSTVLYTQGVDGPSYDLNAGLDADKSGTITVGDLIEHLRVVSSQPIYRAGLARMQWATKSSMTPSLPRW